MNQELPQAKKAGFQTTKGDTSMETQPTTNSWDAVSSGEGKSNILFLNFKNGDSAKLFVLGTPKRFYKKYVPSKKKNIISETEFEGASKRYAVNVLDMADSKIKIWETGARVMTTIKGFKDEMGLENTLIKVTRKGSDMKTTYDLIPRENQQKPAVDMVLYDLDKVFKSTDSEKVKELTTVPTEQAAEAVEKPAATKDPLDDL